MCGLVGVAGNLYTADVQAFNELLYANFVRGKHATGVAAVRGNTSRVLKRAWDPLSLSQHKDFDNVVSMTADVLIGHNRHGTMGDNASHANAHPFQFQHVVGAHNGTLNRSCVPHLHNSGYYDTDSEALYSEINANGLDTAFTKIDGAWALSFYDKRDKTINLIRNRERPLSFAYKKGRGAMFWSSESDLLYWVLNRNKIEIEDETVWTLPVDTLFKWKVERTMGEPEYSELKSSWVAPWQDKTRVWSSEKRDWVPREENNVAPFPPASSQLPVVVAPKIPSSTGTDSKKDPLGGITDGKFKLPYRDGKGQLIGRPRFKRVMEENCCSYCGEDKAEYGEPILFLKTFNSRGVPDFVCTECCKDPEKVELAKAC